MHPRFLAILLLSLSHDRTWVLIFCVPLHEGYLAFNSTKMVDEATKRTVASIPTLKTKAGPRDSDAWVQRLKEEYTSLIKVCCVLIWDFKSEELYHVNIVYKKA